MTIHVGILGAGNISDTHARAAASIPGVAVSAVYGANAEKTARLAASHRAAAYRDLDAFLAHRPLDIVAIGSPSGLHGEQIAAAAARGLHVLVEKPLEITLERVDEAIRAVERAGITLGVFFQDRATPDLVALKQAIDGGQLGRPILATADVKWYRPAEYYSKSRWRGTWALDGGGALMNQGIHTVDLLLWLLGDARRVYGRATTALHKIEVEDTAVAVLEFASGAVATLEATTAAYPGYNRRVEITGTSGTVAIEGSRVTRQDLASGAETDARGNTEPAGQAASSPVVADATPHRRVFEDFIAALSRGGQPRCSAREGRRSVAVVRAIYESSRTGEPVAIDPGERRG
jgi:UDP-N-acetyl-2-amino-2-deoxyglucuronate dehydrogenase